MVRDTTIRSDIVALKTALNWATMERDEKGYRLLKEHLTWYSHQGLSKQQSPTTKTVV